MFLQQESPQVWWKRDGTPAVHDLSGVEERMLQLERDKDSLQLQVGGKLFPSKLKRIQIPVSNIV